MGSLDYNLIDVDKNDENALWYVYYIIIPVGVLIILGIIIAGIVIYIKKNKKVEGDDKDYQGILGESENSKDE